MAWTDIPRGWSAVSSPAPASPPDDADWLDLDEAARFGSRFGTVTSTGRTRERNRRVGGVENSFHLIDRPGGARALDIARGPGVRHADIEAAYREGGYELLESLDEGDHSHLAFKRGPRLVDQPSDIPQGWSVVEDDAPLSAPAEPPPGSGFSLANPAPMRRSPGEVKFNDEMPAEPEGKRFTPEDEQTLFEMLRRGATVDDLRAFKDLKGVTGGDNFAEVVAERDRGAVLQDVVKYEFGSGPSSTPPSLTARNPGLAERVGDFAGDALEPLLGRHGSNRFGNQIEGLGNWTTLGDIDAYREFGDDKDRAVGEGRYVDAFGNMVGQDAAALSIFPIVGYIGKGAKAVKEGAENLLGRVVGRSGREAAADVPATPAIDAFTTRGPLDDPAARLAEGQAIRAELEAGMRAQGRSEAEITAAFGDGPPRRQRDYINVRDIPEGWRVVDEPPLGKLRPLGEQPSPEELAGVARSMRPGDVVPIPANQVEDMSELDRMGDPRPLLQAPDERDVLGMRQLPSGRNRRGPMDLVTWIRAQPWALEDQGGELAHMGISNAPRKGVDLAGGEGFVGRLVGGSSVKGFDDATEAAWEAGFFPNASERPSINDFLDLLGNTYRGGAGRAFRQDDLDEVADYGAAQAERFRIEEAAQSGSPLADDIGQPVGLDDLRAIDASAPSYAYEDLPKIGQRIGNIDTSKLETPRDIARAMKNLSTRMGGFDAARRGKISNEETEALAGELGMTVDDLLKVRKGRAFNAEEATAARIIMAKAYDELVVMAGKFGEGASDEQLAAFHKALLRTAAIHEKVTGAQAEAGRALQSLKITARSNRIGGRIHEAVVASGGGRGRLEQVAKDILELQRLGHEPGKVTKYARDALKPRWADYGVEYYYNALLSGITTQEVNAVGNTLVQLSAPAEFTIAAGIGSARAAAARLMRQQAVNDRVVMSEVGGRVVGMVQGVKMGLKAFSKVMATGDPTDPLTKLEVSRHKVIPNFGPKVRLGNFETQALPVGSILRTPGRAMMAADEFFKATARRSSQIGLSVRKSRVEGLKGEAAKKRAAELAANPTDDIVEQSFDYARYMTMQTKLGGVGNALMRAKESAKSLVLVIPFVRTSLNLLKYSVERTPGLQFALKSVRDDYRAGGARRDVAIAKAMFGSGLGASMIMAAQSGLITGGAPSDPNKRRLMAAKGWQPYSFYIKGKYYSYSRLDPFALMLGTAADIATFADEMDNPERESAYTALTASILGQLESKTWLSGVSDLVQALDDPERFGEEYVSRLAGSFVPTIVAHAAKAIDPVARDTSASEGDFTALRSAGNRIVSRIPGLSDQFPAKRDIFGEEIRSEGGPVATMVSPFYQRTPKDEPVVDELLAADASAGKPRRDFVDEEGNERRMNDSEFAVYQQLAGRYYKADLKAAIADPAWRTLTPKERKAEIKKILTNARADARADVFSPQAEPSDLPPGWSAVLPSDVPQGWTVAN